MKRLEQVRELLRRELGTLLRRELDTPPSTLVSITEILLSTDFAHARVRVSIFPESERHAVFRALSQRASEFRAMLGNRLPNLHPLPHLEFELDKRVEEASRVEELVEKLNTKDSSSTAR